VEGRKEGSRALEKGLLLRRGEGKRNARSLFKRKRSKPLCLLRGVKGDYATVTGLRRPRPGWSLRPRGEGVVGYSLSSREKRKVSEGKNKRALT